eukprot:TRINITY_DN966_c0_g1_i1.p1 TRINITY_DN966_c0_g1~~TRINITY_DN966_c0_g1_i1.p1  ORF type:complete len:1053 (+),score=175.74 TRINITY_DN966_c0_g1_i1:73-3231(+)
MTLMLLLAVYFVSSVLSDDSKRAQSCPYVAGGTNNQKWPKACGSAPEGQLCLTGGSCGCLQDYDCFVNSKAPYCTQLTCSPCYDVVLATTGVDLQDHYWCRDSRYPSLYIASSTDGPDLKVSTEAVAGTGTYANYYREVCFADGSCARCDQANTDSGLNLNIFPTLSSISDVPTQESIWGTIFCDYIRGGASQKPGRPICVSNKGWTNAGLASKVNLDQLTVRMTVAWMGDSAPASLGLTGVYVGARNYPTGTRANQTIEILQPLSNWEGSCAPCRLYDSSQNGNTNPNNIPTTPTAFNSLCSNAMARKPICEPTSDLIGCRACATNAECFQSANCATQGTCTGGLNCYSDGSCRTCVTNSDCAGDGGEVSNQPICQSGICINTIRCSGNYTQGTQNDCTSDKPNCQLDGSCIFCTSNSDCLNDLGGQRICNLATGLCTRCQTNQDCVGSSGANCMIDGSCQDCTSTLCQSSDGGLPASGIAGRCTTSGFCADRNGQVVCNAATRLCEDPCLSNAWCASRTTYYTLGGGANCQMSGLCQDCGVTTVSNSPSCGSNDGPNPSYSGALPTPNQPDCDGSSRTCVSPFVCSINSDCVGKGGANCQASGSCVSCQVTYTTTTCSSSDGGEIKGQINCQLASSLCVDACATNADCIGTQGSNCMSSGLCLSCRSDGDCQSNNNWLGDGGETRGQTLCGANGICTSACTGNYGTATSFPCPSTAANCMSNGQCRSCTSDQDCATSDGPPGTLAINTVCSMSTGICIDPYSCGTVPALSTDNFGCQSQYPGQGRNNCWKDGTCASCTTNSDCYARDGGRTPQQPKCQSDGTCGPCTSNDDCPSNAQNCNQDGFCYDCGQFVTGSCVTLDGPPGWGAQHNCDTYTGRCTDLCTLDSHCTDSCYPKCQVDRGCCVECLNSADCPVAQWRGSETSNTYCDPVKGYICTSGPSNIPPTNPVECSMDKDCNASTGMVACSTSQGKCVGCLFDDHCTDPNKPSCNVGRQTCVQCTSDYNCPISFYCESDFCTTQVIWYNKDNLSSGSFISVSVLLFVSLFLQLLQ